MVGPKIRSRRTTVTRVLRRLPMRSLHIGLALLGMTIAAQAQDGCGPYTALASRLGSLFHEAPAIEAMVDAKNEPGIAGIMVLFASPHGETWTLVVADTKGERGCIIMTGTQWANSLRAIPQGPRTGL